MSILGFYFVSGLLKHAGWPRKQGLLQKQVIDTAILDGAVDQMIDWSASMGAERPDLAVRMIAEMFRDREWDGEGAPNVAQFVNGARVGWDAAPSASPPHAVVRAVPFAKSFGKSMNVEAFLDNRTRVILEQWCLQGIAWGLVNRSRFEEWYRTYTKGYAEMLPLARKSGLILDDSPRDLGQFVHDGEKLLRSYEQEIGPLPSIPSRLLADARSLGLNLS